MVCAFIAVVRFLSTPSARRATGKKQPEAAPQQNFYPRPPRGGRLLRGIGQWRNSDFYPRPPRGGRLVAYLSWFDALEISIHALREEGDRLHGKSCLPWPISIHALREEGDPVDEFTTKLHVNFYPRPPRGGRQQRQRQNLYFLINYTTFCTNLEEP